MLRMQQLIPRATFDWSRYLGRDVYTADNQRVGVVRDVRADPRSGKRALQIDPGQTFEQPLCIPIDLVGIVTRSRLMLDLTATRLSKIAAHEFTCHEEKARLS